MFKKLNLNLDLVELEKLQSIAEPIMNRSQTMEEGKNEKNGPIVEELD